MVTIPLVRTYTVESRDYAAPTPPPHLHDSIGQKLGRGLICEIVTFLPNKCHMGVRSLHFCGYLMGKHDKVRHIQCIPQMASFIAVHM